MEKGEDKARTFVREYLDATCGVKLLDLHPSPDQKTVDFEMVGEGRRLCVAELKTFQEFPPSEERGWTIRHHADGSQESFRENNNGPARILRVVGKAHGQLSMYPHPWAIIILNTDYFLNVGDFFDAFTGERFLGMLEGHRMIDVSSRKVALGHTRTLRYEIDLYIWIEHKRKTQLGVWWSTSAGEAIARQFFRAAEASRF